VIGGNSVDQWCLKGNKFSRVMDERRARVQPCHTALALMRAFAPEVRFSNRLCRTQLRRGMTPPRTSRKSVPQRLKPSSAQSFTARVNPCPSFDGLFPSLSGAVQIDQPKNLIWTGVKFSRPTGLDLVTGVLMQTLKPGLATTQTPLGLV
jgi:hypothetical protein